MHGEQSRVSTGRTVSRDDMASTGSTGSTDLHGLARPARTAWTARTAWKVPLPIQSDRFRSDPIHSVPVHIQQYPINARMTAELGFCHQYYCQQVEPTIWSLARHIDFLDWNLRPWDYNHTEFVPERVLTSLNHEWLPHRRH